MWDQFKNSRAQSHGEGSWEDCESESHDNIEETETYLSDEEHSNIGLSKIKTLLNKN